MNRDCKSASVKAAASVLAILMAFALAQAAPAIAQADDSPPSSPTSDAQLEEFVAAYTNVYFALGACDGFISPQEEAPFDPYGPMLARWPDSFKRQMVETREEGRLESLRLARVHQFTFAERAELCRRQMDSSQADLNRLRARYLR
jgi:hypothetical protein